QLIDIFRRHDRWENTLFVLTSDHGQAFLERDSLYHRFRVDEPIARIPLWLRTPGARQRGVRSSEWASLVDVPRTIAALVGRDTFGDPAARSLLEPVDSAQAPPVYCMTDGIPAGEAPSMPAARRQLLDRLEVAAYRGNFKGVAREDGTVEVYRVSPSAAPASPEAAAPGSERDAIADVARQALELAKARIASHQYHGSVEHRIAGWGY
ncbi:MAG TPA: sulfatase-like hydrolase/transferase, partial [Thermoplasmata archaeon]|nr:sulfatase-like hydrolase/transferase [Thermoplasmata archaeon]